MICPKCSSENVTVSSEQVSAKGSVKGRGCLMWCFHGLMILCTCGLWLLFIKKKAKTKTKFKHKTVALCQNCGNKWTL